jgi:protein-L-isoaspartate O-methyltransferase
LNFFKETAWGSMVLEVGGGSGYMLDLIASETGIKHLYNCEIVPEIYRNQVNKEITLIGGDA